MIFSEKEEILFVAIPKTGTRSIYRFLEAEFDGKILRDHLKKIPVRYQNYYKFTVVRNPYERIVSSWWSTTQRGDDPKGYIKSLRGNTSFDNFIRNLNLLEGVHKNVPHVSPQHLWITPNKFNKIIKYEDLNNEWLKLPFNIKRKKLPFRNPTIKIAKNNPKIRKNYIEYLNKYNVKKIEEFYKKDFEILGYRKLIHGKDYGINTNI